MSIALLRQPRILQHLKVQQIEISVSGEIARLVFAVGVVDIGAAKFLDKLREGAVLTGRIVRDRIRPYGCRKPDRYDDCGYPHRVPNYVPTLDNATPSNLRSNTLPLPSVNVYSIRYRLPPVGNAAAATVCKKL